MSRALIVLAALALAGCCHPASRSSGEARTGSPASAPSQTRPGASEGGPFHWWGAQCCPRTTFPFNPAEPGADARAAKACEDSRAARAAAQPACGSCDCEEGSGRWLPTSAPTPTPPPQPHR